MSTKSRQPRKRKNPDPGEGKGKIPPEKMQLIRNIIVAVIAVVVIFLLIVAIRAVMNRNSDSSSDSSSTESESIPENSYDEENFVSESDGTVSYEDESYYSVMGIDVSSHQGDIDWEALAQEGIEFAILRIGYRGYTEGGLYEDEAFFTNLEGAQENGIQVGAYFYSQAISAEEAEEEAEFVLDILDGTELDFPVFYDWEMQTDEGSRTLDIDESILTDCALEFCQEIEEEGYDAGIYFYSSLALDSYTLTELLDYEFWLSQPGETPDFDYVFTFWQYSITGSLEGISTDVDLDMMLVSVEDVEGTDEDEENGGETEEDTEENEIDNEETAEED